jgi:spore maturation protein CgeB
MKLVFFGTSLARESGHHARVLLTLLDGLVDAGHHIVFFETAGDGNHVEGAVYKVVAPRPWEQTRLVAEAECETASAIVVTSGFGPGAAGIDWLLDLAVPARIYYSLDPWADLGAFDAEGAAPWVRADQVPRFDLVLSLAGGPALEAFKAPWGAKTVAAAYEAIDPARFYPRAPENDLVSDLALVADRDAIAEGLGETWVLAAARKLPNHRFLIAGRGWSGDAWPDNVALRDAPDADERAHIYSSARLVLVAPVTGAIEHALPIELLEPAACAAACAVLDRPGLKAFFEPGEEILVPETGADLVPYLTALGGSRLTTLGNNAEKRVILRYAKLPRSRQVEQLIAREFFEG